jgi:hypothetical protein
MDSLPKDDHSINDKEATGREAILEITAETCNLDVAASVAYAEAVATDYESMVRAADPRTRWADTMTEKIEVFPVVGPVAVPVVTPGCEHASGKVELLNVVNHLQDMDADEEVDGQVATLILCCPDGRHIACQLLPDHADIMNFLARCPASNEKGGAS